MYISFHEIFSQISNIFAVKAKVCIFQEGYKILKQSSIFFWCYWVKLEDCFKSYSFLRIYELYDLHTFSFFPRNLEFQSCTLLNEFGFVMNTSLILWNISSNPRWILGRIKMRLHKDFESIVDRTCSCVIQLQRSCQVHIYANYVKNANVWYGGVDWLAPLVWFRSRSKCEGVR